MAKSAYHVVVLGAVAVAAIAMSWIGYYGSDDAIYLSAALKWLQSPPFLGNEHWQLRHTLVLPTALAMGLFGETVRVAVMATTLHWLALLALTYWFLRCQLGRTTAAVATLLLALTPLLVIGAAAITVDTVELLYLALALILFMRATRTARPGGWLFAAGVALGFAWLTRETAAAIAPLFLVVFVFGLGVERRLLLLIPAGFALVAGSELLVYALATGDPLYRLKVDLDWRVSDSGPRHQIVGATGEGAVDGAVNRHGNLTTGTRAWDMLLMLFANQEYGILHFLAAPAMVWAWLPAVPGSRLLPRLLTIGALGWLAFFLMGPGHLSLSPRYFSFSTFALVVLVAIWLCQGVWPRAPWLAATLGLGLLVVNLLCLYVEDKDPMFAERQLAAYVAANPGTVYTDPETRRRAWFLLREVGAVARVSDDPAPAGARFFHNPRYLDPSVLNARAPAQRQKLLAYRPDAGWPELWRAERAPTWLGRLLLASGVAALLPDAIFQKLHRGGQTVRVLDVTTARAR